MTKRTPWGDADYEKAITDGVVFYGTPGHGGYKVDHNIRANWPAPLRDFQPFNDNTGWYEEDCDCVVLYLAMPRFFPMATIDKIMPMVENLAKDCERWAAVADFARERQAEINRV